MRQVVAGCVAASLCSVVSVAFPGSAAGESVRAYVLVEPTLGNEQAALSALGGLGNCKALTHSLWLEEIVAHIQCDGAEHLNAAIANDIAKSEGVARVTIWNIQSDD